METLIARYGRPRIWAAIGVLLLVILSLTVAWVREPGPIDPAEALANGGHVVKVFVFCGSDGDGLGKPSYRVSTLSGRPPEQDSGELSGNLAQVVVGDDWIGQVRLIWDIGYDTHVEITDLIGAPFGWHDREVYFYQC